MSSAIFPCEEEDGVIFLDTGCLPLPLLALAGALPVAMGDKFIRVDCTRPLSGDEVEEEEKGEAGRTLFTGLTLLLLPAEGEAGAIILVGEAFLLLAGDEAPAFSISFIAAATGFGARRVELLFLAPLLLLLLLLLLPDAAFSGLAALCFGSTGTIGAVVLRLRLTMTFSVTNWSAPRLN